MREALGHFKFAPRVREFIKGVEVLDKAEPLAASAQAETGSKTKAESNEPEVLSAYELFTLTLYQLAPDLPSVVVEAVRRRATRQITVLCRVAGLKMDNFIVLPHSAAHSDVAYQRLRRSVGQKTVRVLSGRWPKNVVNKKIKPKVNLVKES